VTHTPADIFASTAPFYARYRAGYPPELYTHLAERLRLDRTQRALDIGTGTGTLALEMAAHVREVVAIDPEPGMLHEARRLAAERGLTNIDWRRGHSGQLPQLNLGTFQIAVMGQSFHWTDRDDLLAELDGILLPGGAVVIVGGPPPGDTAPPPWAEIAAQIRARYLGHERRAGSGMYSHPTETHQQILARSPFSRVETARWEHTVPRTRDDIVALQLSYSYSSPAQLGDSRAAFERDLGAALDRLEPSGAFLELVYTEVLIATRPDRSSGAQVS
jgi:ubiquinone/menaquinone biosynthesis C-methylase UbiE